MRPRSVLLIIGVACLVPTPASAVTRPTIPGPSEGVQAVVTGGALEIHFTGASAALGRRLAGQEVDLDCDVHPAPGLVLVDEPDLEVERSGRVSADGFSVRVKVAHPRDACELSRSDGFETLARAAVTPLGAVWIDEQVRGTQLVDAAVAAHPTTVYPPIATVVAAGGGRIVALDGPDGTPPPGQIGYWTDGGIHAAWVTLSAAGRRLLLQDLGHRMQRTNVSDAEFGWQPIGGLKVDGSLGASDREPHVRPYDRHAVAAKDGVHATIAGGRLVVRFTGKSAAAYRAVAGHRVSVACSGVPPTSLIGSTTGGPVLSIRVVRVPRRGGVLSLPTLRAHDYCVIIDDHRPVAAVMPTAVGRRWYAAAAEAAAFVLRLPDALASRGATAYPGAATIVAAQGRGFAVMATPDAPLAHGTIGVWTDAAQQAVLATVAPDGTRLVYADEGDGMERSNAFFAFLTVV